MSKKQIFINWLILVALSLIEDMIRNRVSLYWLLTHLINCFLAVQIVRLLKFTYSKIKERCHAQR